jgi:glycosyltransferase involved in cell wall biosynthesis
MRSPKISIVIPIFKVEPYFERCVDSIIKQTYVNLEIIMVNDGSPDRCGEMAEEYAQTDERVIVVHKENGGLSDARNEGMKYVTGDYTLFVDSDDWLDHEMVEEMVKTILTHGADVVQSAFFYAYQDYLLFDNRYYQKDCPPVILENKALMKELVINERVKNFTWGKLYKTEIIKSIPFKKGVLFEDVFWAHQVMQRVKKYVIFHQPLYYYFQRSDSIVASYSPRNLDIIKGLKARQHFIEKNYQELTNEAYKVLAKTILIHYNLLLLNKKQDKDGIYKKDLRLYIKDNYVKLKTAVKNDQELKRQLKLFYIHPYFNVLYLIIKKLARRLRMNPNRLGLEKINM